MIHVFVKQICGDNKPSWQTSLKLPLTLKETKTLMISNLLIKEPTKLQHEWYNEEMHRLNNDLDLFGFERMLDSLTHKFADLRQDMIVSDKLDQLRIDEEKKAAVVFFATMVKMDRGL